MTNTTEVLTPTRSIQDEIEFTCRCKDLHAESTVLTAPLSAKLSDITEHLVAENFLQALAGTDVWEVRVDRTNEVVGLDHTLSSAGVEDGDTLHWTRSVNGAREDQCSR